VLGVVAQRLIRKVCMKCREPHAPSAFELEELGMRSLPAGVVVYKAKGCPTCSQTGYQGRTVIHELLVLDDEMRALIVKASDAGTIKRSAVSKGMKTLREDGVAKVLQGITTVEELMRATHAEV
jgi:type II secretory ATPase GspE/PulE/Tfp pilus assembly ATPase PilB-like protein